MSDLTDTLARIVGVLNEQSAALTRLAVGQRLLTIAVGFLLGWWLLEHLPR